MRTKNSIESKKKEKKVSHAIFISFSDDKLMNQNIQHFERIFCTSSVLQFHSPLIL